MNYEDNPALGDRIAIIDNHHDAAVHAENQRLRAKCERLEGALRQISICGSLDRLPSGKFWQGDRFDYAIETAHNALNKKEDK